MRQPALCKPRKIQTVFADSMSEEQGGLIMTIAEQLRKEGQSAGIEIGRHQIALLILSGRLRTCPQKR